MNNSEGIPSVRLQLANDELLFGKVAIPEMFTEPSAEFHREVADHLIDHEIRKLLIQAPRKHAKSSLVGCVHVLHHIMYDEGPKFVVLVSKTQGHAKLLLGTIKDVLEKGRKFRKIFGYWGRFSARQWTESVVILKDGTMIMALGTGQMIIGLKHIHQRPTLEILDDPEDTENTKTAEALNQNLTWLLKALMPTLSPNGRIVVIGTPQCEGCMVESIEKMPGWTPLHYDAIVNEDTHEVLWPERCSWDFLMSEKADYDSGGKGSLWYSEYRCTIVSDEEQLFKPEYNRYYRGWLESSRIGKAYLHITHIADKKADLDAGKLEEEEIRPVNVFMGVDPASSTARRADNSVNFKGCVDKDWNIFFLPYFRKRVPPTEHCQAIVEDYEAYYPLKTTVEATGYQEALRDILRKFSQLWTKDGKPIRIPGLEAKELPREKKTKRHKTALHIHFYQRHVYLLEGMEAFEEEARMWREDKTKIDDLFDGLYFMLLKAYTPEHEYEKTGKPSHSMEWGDEVEEDYTYA